MEPIIQKPTYFRFQYAKIDTMSIKLLRGLVCVWVTLIWLAINIPFRTESGTQTYSCILKQKQNKP